MSGSREAGRSLRRILVLFCGLLAAACDPCFGTAACGDSLDVSATGQVIEFRSGEGLTGVELIFRRTGGVQLIDPVESVTTGANGMYDYRARAQEPGSVTFSVTVRPPAPFPDYTVQDITIATSAVKGEGQPLGRWLANPHFAFVGEVHMLDPREAARMECATPPCGSVEFVRRGGVDVVPDSILTYLDPYGRFFFNPAPLGVGDVIFDLIFKLHGYGPETVRRTISTRHVDTPIDLTEVLYLPCVPFHNRIPCL